jgi:hypothetical protein
MALPPKGDPRRPLHLAVRSNRVLGIVFLLFGTCSLMPMIFLMTRGGVRAGIMPPQLLVAVSAVYFIPGALFMVFSVFLARRRPWAVVASIVVSTLVGLTALLGVFGMAVAMLTVDDSPWQMAIPLVICALLAVAVAQLIYHLAKSFEAIKHPPFGQEIRGFEPLPVMPAWPGGSYPVPSHQVLPPQSPYSRTPPHLPQPPPYPADSNVTTHDPSAPR